VYRNVSHIWKWARLTLTTMYATLLTEFYITFLLSCPLVVRLIEMSVFLFGVCMSVLLSVHMDLACLCCNLFPLISC